MNKIVTKFRPKTGAFLTAVISIVVLPTLARADFSCTSDVFYRWLPAAAGTPKTPSVPAATAAPVATSAPDSTPQAAAAAGSEKELTGELEVQFASINATGATEEEAKKKLGTLALRRKIEAENTCRQAHENVGSCIASRYEAVANTMQTMSFPARRSLENAIEKDCKTASGQCTLSANSEFKCAEVVAAAVATAPADDKKGGKDKKK